MRAMPILLSLVLAALVPTVHGQSEATSVGGDLIPAGSSLCQNNGTTHATCHGRYKQGDIIDVAVGGTANVKYGFMTADARAVVNCSTGCVIGAYTVSGSGFTDSVNIEGAPTSGAYLLIKGSLSGAFSSALTSSLEFQLNINGSTAQCAVSALGSCFVQVPVTSQTQSFNFSAALASTVTANLSTSGEAATDTEYADLTGKITELAVVNGDGKVLRNVVITTASGHLYPK